MSDKENIEIIHGLLLQLSEKTSFVVLIDNESSLYFKQGGNNLTCLGMLEAERARARMNMLQKFSAQEERAEDDRT